MLLSSQTLMRVASVVAMMVSITLPGCATLEEQEPAAKATIQFVVMNEIEQSSDRAAKAKSIAAIAGEATVMLDVESVTLPELKTKIMQRLAERDLEPSRMLAASFLVDAVGQEIQKRIGEGILSPEDKVTVNKVLSWVEEAASFYGRAPRGRVD